MYPVRQLGLGSLCWTVLFLACLRAEIGEGREDLRKRYGAGKEVGDQLLFSNGGYQISTYFAGDTVTMEIYSLAADPHGNVPEWTPEKREEIMRRQASGQTWLQGKSSKKNETYWVRSDQKVAARYIPDKQVLVFLSTKLKR